MGDPKDIERFLGESFNVRVTNVPELEHRILIVLDYSPSDSDKLISMAFGIASEPKCWLTESAVQEIDNDGPRPHSAYKEFIYNERQFYPYSIKALLPEVFTCLSQFEGFCRRLYQHVVWT